MIRRLVVLAALQLVCALPASAQQDGASGIVFWTEFSALAIGSTHRLLAKTDLRPGDTVRLAWRDAAGVRQKSNGRLSTIGDDSLTFTTDGVEHRVARADLLDGQVYRGRERLWAQGFTRGLEIGAALGVATGLLTLGRHNVFSDGLSSGERFVLVGALSAAAGSMTGAAIGAFMHGDRWMRVDRPRSTGRASVTPRIERRQLGATARITF